MQIPVFTIRWLSCVIALFAATTPIEAAVYAVGSEAGCTHTTIQAAVDAAEANPGEDFIRIPHSRIWTNSAIVINTAQTLSLEGFWSDCNTIDGSQSTTLDGAGGSAAPVLRINGVTGSVIRLDRLAIRNGDVSGNGKGGGIYYRGNGILYMSNTSVFNNVAGLGGGLYLEGTGEAAVVTIGGNVGITGNTARYDGGGVFAEAVNFNMIAPNSIIAFNKAEGVTVAGTTLGGRGGGLVVNPTTSLNGYATIGSSGVGNAGAIYSNTARSGGGVAVLGESDSFFQGVLFLYATQPGLPAKIDQNFASERGGGIYLNGHQHNVPSFAKTFLWNATIEGNAAPEGSAIYLGEVARVAWFVGSPPAAAAPCPGNSACGRIANNIDQDALGQPTGGAVIRAESNVNNVISLGGSRYDGNSLGPRGVILEGNRGGRLIDLDADLFSGQGADLEAYNVLIAGNQATQSLIRVTGRENPNFILHDATIAGNTISGGAVLDFLSAVALELKRVLIWQPGTTTLTGNGTPSVEWTIASEAQSLGGGPGAVTVASPRFIDPTGGDYRLRASSPAIDRAPPITGDDRDVFGLPRDQDIPVVPGVVSYVRDIGAHERPSLLPLLLNGEFVGGTNQWSLPAGHAGSYQSPNAPGSPAGSGAAQVTGTNGNGRLLGYVQCIHLPGPGTYALNGSVLTAVGPQVGNPTALIWELRADGAEGCIDGAITASGAHALGTTMTDGEWVRPTNPAYVSVPESMWNHNTSLTVIMAVYANASNNDYNAYFDAITLEWGADGSDVIFADGFEGL